MRALGIMREMGSGQVARRRGQSMITMEGRKCGRKGKSTVTRCSAGRSGRDENVWSV